MPILYGTDGRPIVDAGKLVVGDPATCPKCCDIGRWWRAIACTGGIGTCGCAVTNFSPYVYIRVADRCPGESSPPAVNRVVQARSDANPDAYGCFILQNAPGDRQYTAGEADPAFRATIINCADGCDEPGCSEIATFAQARNCDPSNAIQIWTCLDKVRASQFNGHYFCGGPSEVRTFNDCPSTIISNAIVVNDWPETSSPLVSCCDATESGGTCSKQFVFPLVEPACPGGGVVGNIAPGWICMYCCDPLLPTTENAVEYSETYTDLLGGVSYSCNKAGPCDQYGNFPIHCSASDGQEFDVVGYCNSCQYVLDVFSAAGPVFTGLCSVDNCATGLGDRVEVAGSANVFGNGRNFNYLAKQYFCNGVQRFEWSINYSITWTRGREACQGGCGLKDACFPNPGRPGGRAGRAQVARPGVGVRLDRLRGVDAMADAQRAVRAIGVVPGGPLVAGAGGAARGKRAAKSGGCATCGVTPAWQDVSIEDLFRGQ